MPAKSPRLNVTVTSRQHAVLLELGALQGRSAASFLREMLDGAMPMLDALLPIYRAAALQEAMQPEALQKAIRDAIAGVEAGRDQLDFLGALAASEANLANDRGDDGTPGPSEAREDVASPARRGRKAS